ncbi:MAG: MmgE/PrpD family protein [bacterium]|nr:MmgE/PrpD family protein [bacterium]
MTRKLADFAAGLAYEEIPEEVLSVMRDDALDSVAVGIFGSSLTQVILATELWEELGGAPQATVWGRPSKLPVPVAVRANSHAQNAFEYDDTYVWSGFGIHPGNNVVPAAVAVSEMLGGASGRDFVTALTTGHEVAVRVRMGVTSAPCGHNYTALCSTFGAAAAAGRLLGLDSQEMQWALGAAGAYVGALLTVPPDSMVKQLVNGRAAEGGVMGAMLARRGFTGVENILEAAQGGFYSMHSSSFDFSRVLKDLGQTFHCVHVHAKRYPIITSAQHAVEAACELRARESFAPDDISKIVVRTNARSQKSTTGFAVRTLTSAQMSLAFGVATAVLTGNILPEAVSESALKNPALVRLMTLVEPVVDTEFGEVKQESGGPAQVIVYLKDGSVLRSPVIPDIRRMTTAEIERKAEHLISLVFSRQRAQRLLSVFEALPALPDIVPLFPLLAP